MNTVLVTGACRGIGAAIARRFALAHDQVIITCMHDLDALYHIQQELTALAGIPCIAVPCDMSSPEAVEALFASIPAPDILINNAGVSYFGLLSEMSAADWHRVLDTNLSACFYTCRLAIPAMVHKKAGRILNISSVWGNVGASMEAAYSASKGGLNALTRALAKELAPSNIQVNAIAPGVIDTAMNQCLGSDDLEALRAEIPADRLGTPEEVAELAFQLAHAPAYLTGQILTIDGGWL